MADVKKIATRDAYGKALAVLGAEHDIFSQTTVSEILPRNIASLHGGHYDEPNK